VLKRFGKQAGLADPRFALDKDRLTGARAPFLQARSEPGDLFVPAHKGHAC
jgi:hypothetical protein